MVRSGASWRWGAREREAGGGRRGRWWGLSRGNGGQRHPRFCATLAPGAPAPRSPQAPLRPGVMDGLAQNGLGANPQSAACWAQLDQQQASWYFWINTNKSSFSSWQVVRPLPPPAPCLSSSPTGARGQRGDVNLGCRELDGDGSQALRWAEIWLGKTPKLWVCKTSHCLQFFCWLVDEWGQVSPILVPQFPLSGVVMVTPFPAAPKAWVSRGCKGAPRSWVWPLASGWWDGVWGAVFSIFSSELHSGSCLQLHGCARG